MNNILFFLKELKSFYYFYPLIPYEKSELRIDSFLTSDIMIDQLRAIDNKRLVNKIGKLPQDLVEKVVKNIQIVLDIGSF